MRTLFSEPKRPIDWLKNRFEKSWERVRRRKGTGRPRTDRDVQDLIRTMTRANPTWGMRGSLGNWESWESRLARRRSTSIAFGKEARRRREHPNRRPGLLVDASFARKTGNQMRWNEIANLLEYAELTTRWLGLGFCFHPCWMAGSNPIRPAFF